MTQAPEPSDAEVALTLGTLVLRLLNGEEFSLLDEIEAMPPIVNHLMLAALLLIVSDQIDKGALTTTDFRPTTGD